MRSSHAGWLLVLGACDRVFGTPEPGDAPVVPVDVVVDAAIDAPVCPMPAILRPVLEADGVFFGGGSESLRGGQFPVATISNDLASVGLFRFEVPARPSNKIAKSLRLVLHHAGVRRACNSDTCDCAAIETAGNFRARLMTSDWDEPTFSWACRREVGACLSWNGASTAGDRGPEPCSLEARCGDDEVCDIADPGGGRCIPKTGDVDGDGLPNDRDFCHRAPGGAFDEDGDLLGDSCDPCPIARPLATLDADGDAVESPCDPDASEPGDTIAVFEGFNEAIPASWFRSDPAAATWELRGGEVLGTTLDPSTLGTLTAPLPLVTTRMAVLAQYRIDRADGAATQNFAGVTAIDRRPAGIAAVTCGGARAGGIDNVLLDTDTGASSQPLMGLFDPASLYRIAQKLEGAVAGCAFSADDRSDAVQASTGGEAPTEAGFAIRGATTRFQYLLVIQRPQ